MNLLTKALDGLVWLFYNPWRMFVLWGVLPAAFFFFVAFPGDVATALRMLPIGVGCALGVVWRQRYDRRKDARSSPA